MEKWLELQQAYAENGEAGANLLTLLEMLKTDSNVYDGSAITINYWRLS
jgi:hypothetical protein